MPDGAVNFWRTAREMKLKSIERPRIGFGMILAERRSRVWGAWSMEVVGQSWGWWLMVMGQGSSGTRGIDTPC